MNRSILERALELACSVAEHGEAPENTTRRAQAFKEFLDDKHGAVSSDDAVPGREKS
jgi:hypothetical protein